MVLRGTQNTTGRDLVEASDKGRPQKCIYPSNDLGRGEWVAEQGMNSNYQDPLFKEGV